MATNNQTNNKQITTTNKQQLQENNKQAFGLPWQWRLRGGVRYENY
jgi:hypothetical protein